VRADAVRVVNYFLPAVFAKKEIEEEHGGVRQEARRRLTSAFSYSSRASSHGKIQSHHEGTKNELEKVNHKGHKEHIAREARKIIFLRPLRLNHPNRTAIAVPSFVTFVLFVVKTLLLFGCGFAALRPLWLKSFSAAARR
jgi:hypothetical protein